MLFCILNPDDFPRQNAFYRFFFYSSVICSCTLRKHPICVLNNVDLASFECPFSDEMVVVIKFVPKIVTCNP